MKDIRRWFGWTVIIGPLHMCEQLLFGIDQVDELRGYADAYYSLLLFPGNVPFGTCRYTHLTIILSPQFI